MASHFEVVAFPGSTAVAVVLPPHPCCPPHPPLLEREKSRSSGSTRAPKQMGVQVCARQASQFLSQAGAHGFHDLTLVRGRGGSTGLRHPHTSMSAAPVHVLSSSLKPVFALSSTAVPGWGPF